MLEVYALTMVMAVVSFLGFSVENVWLALTKGYMDNRNMCFPFLIGYGMAIVAIYLLFGTPSDMHILGWRVPIKSKWLRRALYFTLMVVCVCLGEIVLGTAVEKICHFYWWDYSRLPLHITRYTSLPTSAGFGMLILVFMDRFFLPLYRWFLSWEPRRLKRAAVALAMLMLGDYLYNALLMYVKEGGTQRWKWSITDSPLFAGWKLRRKHGYE
ncbi:MAG: putative ABC transporter permease [Firmicutes bacterium]|nr:putative ABC transporter permease [Bacillota bacterium]